MIEAEIYFLKRWSSINVKIYRILEALQNNTNENIQSYLRAYTKELETTKQEEKDQLNEVLDKIKNHCSEQPKEN